MFFELLALWAVASLAGIERKVKKLKKQTKTEEEKKAKIQKKE